MEGGKALQRLTCLRFVDAVGLGGRGAAVLSCQLLAGAVKTYSPGSCLHAPPPSPPSEQAPLAPNPGTRAPAVRYRCCA